MTQEGYDKMVAQLRHMESVERPAASAAIAEARDKGDLSENSEYDAAKEAQASMEQRVVEIENIIQNAKIVSAEDSPSDVVSICSSVKVYDCDFEEEIVYTIVGSTEADPLNNKISDESPIGQGLLGKKLGETVDVDTPNGTITFKILEIQK